MPKQLHDLLLEGGDAHAWEAAVIWEMGQNTVRGRRALLKPEGIT